MTQPLETTKEGQRQVFLRLSMLHSNGTPVDYDETIKNSQASYDEARTKLSNRWREKSALGWDTVGRFIGETMDMGKEIQTRLRQGKTWEFDGPAAEPKPAVAPVVANGIAAAERPEAKSVARIDRVEDHPPTADDFLEQLGEICMAHKIVIEGEGLRLAPFSMKAFRKMLALGE